MAPFYGWGSTSSRLIRVGSLHFITKFPDIPGNHFINLRRMKGGVDIGATPGFEHGTSGLRIHSALTTRS